MNLQEPASATPGSHRLHSSAHERQYPHPETRAAIAEGRAWRDDGRLAHDAEPGAAMAACGGNARDRRCRRRRHRSQTADDIPGRDAPRSRHLGPVRPGRPGFAEASQEVAANYARYVTAHPALDDLRPAVAAKVVQITASAVPESNVIQLEATARSVQAARAAAQAASDGLMQQVKRLTPNDASGQDAAGIQQAEHPERGRPARAGRGKGAL
jgi:hypothetical protein